MLRKTDTIVIGAGQAGLATSRCLSDLDIDHVVFERGQIGQRWVSERWNSLNLLTPNWMNDLPGFGYSGDDPHGFMHKNAVASMLSEYQRSFDAPVLTGTQVLSVSRQFSGFNVVTQDDVWHARSVVVATGACDIASIPQFAALVDPKIQQFTPSDYKSPDQIGPGGVLVVGASATGVQLADEMIRSGHDVTLAVGNHVRVPRTYRGRDLMYWLTQSGVLTEPRDPNADPTAVLRYPSLQLVGGAGQSDINLATLQAKGARIIGRLRAAAGNRIEISDTLGASVRAAEQRQKRLLRRIDSFIDAKGLRVPDESAPSPIKLADGPDSIDLAERGIATIIWATGYRRSYPWLNLPVLTRAGEIRQAGGVTPVRGLFTMGLPFMRHRSSSFIAGVGQDARTISHHIAAHLGHSAARAA